MWPFKKHKIDPLPKTIDYDSFAEKCVEEVKVLQDKFQHDYSLTWYENWFYSQSIGLLTFSTEDVQLNFKYVDIGSFSEKSKTWKWSWDNEYTLDNVKRNIELIKDFGRTANYSKLTTGYFDSNEIEAWEFVSVAAKILNGIGVYRPVNDQQLKMFFVITEFVDEETAQKIKDRYIECSKHEYRRVAFVCKHLNLTTKVGFEEAFETEEGMELLEDDDFQAWCNECELERRREGEWNDKSMEFAGIRLVCEKCYFEMKEFNLGFK